MIALADSLADVLRRLADRAEHCPPHRRVHALVLAERLGELLDHDGTAPKEANPR